MTRERKNPICMAKHMKTIEVFLNSKKQKVGGKCNVLF